MHKYIRGNHPAKCCYNVPASSHSTTFFNILAIIAHLTVGELLLESYYWYSNKGGLIQNPCSKILNLDPNGNSEEVKMPKVGIVLGWVIFLALGFWCTLSFGPPIIVGKSGDSEIVNKPCGTLGAYLLGDRCKSTCPHSLKVFTRK